MRPLTIAADVASREILTEAFVSDLVLDIVRRIVPGAESDDSLSTDATAREDHFRVAVSTRRYQVYEWLETWGATVATELYRHGVPSLIYPGIVRPEPSRARTQAEFLQERGIVRIVVPFEPTFIRQSDGTIARESLTTARERILEVVRQIAPSARPAPEKIGSPKNETHLHLDADEYATLAERLPNHLLDEL